MMYVVPVKLQNNDKEFCFTASKEVFALIVPPAHVVVHTKFKDQVARVVNAPFILDENDPEQMAKFAERFGVNLPYQPVLGVLRLAARLDEVTVPYHFRKPNREKLENLFFQYLNDGWFDTAYKVDENGVLRDGYSAYLIAQQLNRRVFTWLDRGVEKE